jgi:hypothetical protein
MQPFGKQGRLSSHARPFVGVFKCQSPNIFQAIGALLGQKLTKASKRLQERQPDTPRRAFCDAGSSHSPPSPFECRVLLLDWISLRNTQEIAGFEIHSIRARTRTLQDTFSTHMERSLALLRVSTYLCPPRLCGNKVCDEKRDMVEKAS